MCTRCCFRYLCGSSSLRYAHNRQSFFMYFKHQRYINHQIISMYAQSFENRKINVECSHSDIWFTVLFVESRLAKLCFRFPLLGSSLWISSRNTWLASCVNKTERAPRLAGGRSVSFQVTLDVFLLEPLEWSQSVLTCHSATPEPPGFWIKTSCLSPQKTRQFTSLALQFKSS